MKITRFIIACILSVAVLGGTWLARAQEVGDAFLLYPVKFDGSPGKGQPTPRVPSGWRLVSTSGGRAPNETNLWFQDASGSVFMVQGFKDPNSREFLVYHYVNEIEAEK